MKTRAQEIAQLALGVIYDQDVAGHGPMTEAVIIVAVNVRIKPKAANTEMDDALDYLERTCLIEINTRSPIKGNIWNITARGRAEVRS